MREGLLIVVSGPSGVGKGTVCNCLLEEIPGLEVSVSVTTRSPREGEVNGTNYFFTDRSNFLKLVNEGYFLEWAEIYGDLYGTPEGLIEEKRSKGLDVLLEIDTQGARKVKKNYPAGVFIFLLPPTLEELKKRIINRKTENKEDIEKRMSFALEEIKEMKWYDYVIINDQVEEAVAKINAIVKAEKCRTARNRFLINKYLKEASL
ncbi:MAG TPA: guanylate kinase [Firmicutes bacterium]|nr:guanylate kinase [Bacillota bacterium]